MPSKYKEHPPLDNNRHEQFARCLGAGNDLMVCYVGVGYPMDEGAAKSLARTDGVRQRAEDWCRTVNKRAWRKKGYKHPV